MKCYIYNTFITKMWMRKTGVVTTFFFFILHWSLALFSFLFFFFGMIRLTSHNFTYLKSTNAFTVTFWFRQPILLFFFFSCLYSKLLVSSTHFASSSSFFLYLVISFHPLLFIFIFLYTKLLVNPINCHNIFTIIDVLIRYRSK